MASIINSTILNGITFTADNSNTINIQSGGINSISIDNGNVIVPGSLITLGPITLSPNLTLTGTTLSQGNVNVIDAGIQVTNGNISVSNGDIYLSNGSIISNKGLYSLSASNNSFEDGIVIDYTPSTGRISVGLNDSINFYTGGAGQILIARIDKTGTVSANYFSGKPVGSGEYLSNINAANVTVGKLSTSVMGSGTANAAGYLAGDGTWKLLSQGFIAPINLNKVSIDTDFTIPTGQNGMTLGPILQSAGCTLTISSGQRWLIQ